jgi:hypothetical protein
MPSLNNQIDVARFQLIEFVQQNLLQPLLNTLTNGSFDALFTTAMQYVLSLGKRDLEALRFSLTQFLVDNVLNPALETLSNGSLSALTTTLFGQLLGSLGKRDIEALRLSLWQFIVDNLFAPALNTLTNGSLNAVVGTLVDAVGKRDLNALKDIITEFFNQLTQVAGALLGQVPQLGNLLSNLG